MKNQVDWDAWETKRELNLKAYPPGEDLGKGDISKELMDALAQSGIEIVPGEYDLMIRLPSNQVYEIYMIGQSYDASLCIRKLTLVNLVARATLGE